MFLAGNKYSSAEFFEQYYPDAIGVVVTLKILLSLSARAQKKKKENYKTQTIGKPEDSAGFLFLKEKRKYGQLQSFRAVDPIVDGEPKRFSDKIAAIGLVKISLEKHDEQTKLQNKTELQPTRA